MERQYGDREKGRKRQSGADNVEEDRKEKIHLR